MQAFIKNKDGKIRFSQRDAEWLTLYAGEADSVTIQVGDLQNRAQLDRQYINTPVVLPDPAKK